MIEAFERLHLLDLVARRGSAPGRRCRGGRRRSCPGRPGRRSGSGRRSWRSTIAGVSLADLGARVDDVQEHGVQVVAAVGGQVGADLAPLAEEGVAARSTGRRRSACPAWGRRGRTRTTRGQPVDLGLELGRGRRPDRARSSLRDQLGDPRVAAGAASFSTTSRGTVRGSIGPASIASRNAHGPGRPAGQQALGRGLDVVGHAADRS